LTFSISAASFFATLLVLAAALVVSEKFRFFIVLTHRADGILIPQLTSSVGR
jgi:hypothetical protein